MSSFINDVFGESVAPLKTLIISLLGILIASWLVFDRASWALVVVVAGVLTGYVIESIGKSLLPQSPVAALRCFEFWILGPACIAAFASGLSILITISFLVPDSMEASQAEIIKALSSSLTAFIGAGFVTATANGASSRHAKRIYEHFHDAFPRDADATHFPGNRDMYFVGEKIYVKGSSTAEGLIEDSQIGNDVGWAYATRWKRAHSLATRIKWNREQVSP